MNNVIREGKLTVGQYEINVKVIDDNGMIGLFDTSDMAEEIKSSDLPNKVYKSFAYYGSDFAVDNDDHKVYVKVDSWRFSDMRFFVLRETLKESQQAILEYAKSMGLQETAETAWLKALRLAKNDKKYIQEYFNGDWSFVGLNIRITARMTDKSGLIWSRQVDYAYGDVWGVEWSHSSSIINNEQGFKCQIPDVLPECITLTDEQLNNLWLSLE